jgi:hypothetical protein
MQTREELQGHWQDSIHPADQPKKENNSLLNDLVDVLSNATDTVLARLESVGETTGDVLKSASDVACEVGNTALSAGKAAGEAVGEALGSL